MPLMYQKIVKNLGNNKGVGLSKKVFLCLDFGTESVRGELITLEGKNLFEATKGYKTYFPQNGWVEQKPEELWAAMVHACKELGRYAKENHIKIESLCIDSTACCLLFLDANKQPLGNMIMWMDVRSKNTDISHFNLQSRALNYHIGQQLPSTWMPLRIQWVKKYDVKRYQESEYVCELLDWLQYKLTGELVHSQNISTLKWYYGSEGQGWPDIFYNELGIGDLLGKLSDKVLPSGEVVEKMLTTTANELGIEGNPIIVEGGADAFVGTLGLGVIDEGDVAVIGGSSHVVLCTTKEQLHLPGMFGAFPNALIPGLGILEGSQTSSGSTLRWYVNNFIQPGISYKELDYKAAYIPAGSEGLLVLDHWQGNRSPFFDEDSRGVIRGLSLAHTPFHLFRAIMEGVSIGTAVITDKLKENNYSINKLFFGGGVRNSRLWLQIHADTIGLPVYVPKIENAQLLGCAALSAYSCGYYKTKTEAVKRIKRTEEVIEPIIENVEIYAKMKEVYLETYNSLYGRN